MKIQDTKMYGEFVIWFIDKNYFEFELFINHPFEFQEGIYRVFLRERGIEIEIRERYSKYYYEYQLKDQVSHSVSNIGYKDYEKVFMNLVTEIFDK